MKKLRSTARSASRRRGLECHQLHLVAGQQPLQRGHVEPVLVHGYADDARARMAQRLQHAYERGRLDHGDVAVLERRSRREAQGLLGARGHDDLVPVRGPSRTAATCRELFPERPESLGGKIGESLAALLLEHRGGDASQLRGRVERGRRPAHGQRYQTALAGGGEDVGEYLLGIADLPLRERVDLPIVAVLGAARRSERSDEGATADAGRHIAEFGELAVDAGGGQVIDAHARRQLARRGKLLARLELAGLDRIGEAIHELLREGDLAFALQCRQVDLVRHCWVGHRSYTSGIAP
jgi:hypothetical protein